MSVVNIETGEIIDPMDAAEARRLTTEAQSEFRSAVDHFGKGWSLVQRVVEGGGWQALGYRSPGDYVSAEFDGALASLNVAERRIAVREAAALGYSTRAIAPVVGVTRQQVSKDLRAGGNPVATSQAPESGAALGPVPVEAHKPRQAEVVDPPPTPAPVVGIDGKTYSRPTNRATPRPAAERTLALIQTLAAKAAREAETLTPDQVRRVRADAGHVTASLRHSIETLQRLADALTPMEDQ